MKKVVRQALSLFSASFLFGTAIAQPSDLHRVSIGITGVSLQKPEGFEVADTFHGFQQDSTGASVMITLIPGPYADVTQGLTKEALDRRGIQLISKQPMTIADQPGLLLHLSQRAYGETFMKWLAVFGDAAETRMVTATFPEEQVDELSESLRAVVLSSKLSESGNEIPSLPFDIGRVDGLIRLKELAGLGKVVAFSKTGIFPSPSPLEPFFMVAPSLGEVPILDPKSFAVQKLNQTPHTDNISIETIADIQIDGLTGFEIEAMGQDQTSKQKVMLYLVMLFPESGGYIVMQGLAEQKERHAYLTKFRSLARTYRAQQQY